MDSFTSEAEVFEKLRESRWKPAGFWVRAGAMLIDLLIIAAYVLLWFFAADRFPALGRYTLPALAVLPLLYFSVMVALAAQTLGKMAAGIRVIAEDDSPVGPLRAVWRSLMYCCSIVFCPGLLLALKRDKRALHDHLAGTRVVYAPGVGLLRRIAFGLCCCLLLFLGVRELPVVARRVKGFLPTPPVAVPLPAPSSSLGDVAGKLLGGKAAGLKKYFAAGLEHLQLQRQNGGGASQTGPLDWGERPSAFDGADAAAHLNYQGTGTSAEAVARYREALASWRNGGHTALQTRQLYDTAASLNDPREFLWVLRLLSGGGDGGSNISARRYAREADDLEASLRVKGE